MKQYYVYILECSDKSYYTGITNNIERRLVEHKLGLQKDSYTFVRRPLKLVFCTDFLDPNQAIAFEKQVKGWTRAKKEAIINDNWDKLKALAECKNETSHKGFDSAQPDDDN
ncbi:MAG: GIY-YIG nuclease family protein [Flavobacteriaceae bacterium]|nr:GIY-YIG nuclease family protein [Flavobacteriaceae bacterium]